MTVLTLLLALVLVVGFSVIIWLRVQLRRSDTRLAQYRARLARDRLADDAHWLPPGRAAGGLQQNIQQLVALQTLQLLQGLGAEREPAQPQLAGQREELLPTGYFNEQEQEFWYD